MAANSLKLDFILLHYALKDKRFTLELSKEVEVEYFDPKIQLFYSILDENFKNPLIREVLSLPAMLDYCKTSKVDEKHFTIITNIYKKATELIIGGENLADEDFRYYLSRFKSRWNVQVASQGLARVSEALIKNPENPEDANDAFKKVLQEINEINRIQVYDEGTLGEDVDNMLAEYAAIEENPEPFRGVTVGCPSYDNKSGGLHKGELTLIAGMEGSGKSMLMMNWAINAWLGTNNPYSDEEIVPNGHNILYFSLEMPRSNKGEYTQGSYLNKRMLSCVSGLKLWEMQHGKLEIENKEKLQRSAEFIKRYEESYNKFHVIDIPRGARVDDIEAKYIELQEKMQAIDLVVIDYLGIMAADKDDSDHLVQGHVAESMHEFARTYNIPVLSAVQMNRPSGQTNSLDSQKYNTNRVARSAMISQNANNVLMIETRDNEHEKEGMIVHITKMRDGEKGKMIFTKNFPCMQVIDEIPESEMSESETEDIAIIESEFEDLE